MRALALFTRSVSLLLVATSVAASQGMRDMTLGSRPLTDADMEKFVAITHELTIAKKGIPEISSPAGLKAVRDATIKAADKHGWATLDFNVVGARVMTAETIIKNEARVPVPAEKRADVDIVRKWLARILDAKAGRTKSG
jgi:hypothetical protein